MKTYFPVTLLLVVFGALVCLPAILPYFHSGYFPTHDGEWAVVRLADMYRTVKDFQIPARYSTYLNYGYGYPLFNFAYPFPYYVGSFFHVLGLGLVDTIKLLFAITVPLSFFAMYSLSYTIWRSHWSSIISSILYIYLPYRFVDLYVRGSLGESFAFALFPLVALCMVQIVKKKDKTLFIILGALLYTVLIVSHNIMAVLFSLVLIGLLLGLQFWKKEATILSVMSTVVLSFLLSAFFWFPALMEKSLIALAKIPIAQRGLYFVSPIDLIIPRWGYGVPLDTNGFSYQIGWPHVALFFAGLVCLLFQIVQKKRENLFLAWVIAGMVFLLTITMFSQFSFVWRLPILSEINYPWTMLLPIGFLVSLFCGILGCFPKVRYLAVLFSVAAIVVFSPYARPEKFVNRGDEFYATNDATTTSSDELMPLWVEARQFSRTDSLVDAREGQATISNTKTSYRRVSFSLKSNDIAKIQVKKIYYPGWIAFADNKQIEISYNNPYGFMDILLPKGAHTVELRFTETRERVIANLLSIVGLFGLCGVFLFRKRFVQ